MKRNSPLSLLWSLVAAGLCLVASPVMASGIAVAPFASSAEAASTAVAVSNRLAERIAERSAVRVVPPQKTGMVAVPDLETEQTRAWSERLAVDSIVVGSVESVAGAHEVAIDVRSGHSGGPISRHRVRVANLGDVDRAAGELADAVMDALGIALAEPLPAVAAEAPESPERAAGDGGRSRDLFSLESGDEPLSIDSDELELTERGENRHLIFRRNVRVTQGDMELRTEELEAFYESGFSQPQRLVATGQVRVRQGERRARCDRAIYRRADQTVECIGHAELVQRCDRVRGQTIRFDLDRDRVWVLGGASVVITPDAADSEGCAVETGS